MVDYLGGVCVDCGYFKCLRSLVFHHLDPKAKEFAIGVMINKSWAKIIKELDKCVLLCANCHGERHEKMDRI